MRAIYAAVLLAASIGGLPACGSSDECHPDEVVGEGDVAGGQASCAWRLAIGDVTYVPSCEAVPRRALAGVVVDGDASIGHVVARALIGVPQEQAVAMHTRLRGVDDAQLERRYGRWSFAPATDLDGASERSLLRSVTSGTSAGQA